MVRVHRVQLVRREVREYLSPSALEILFAHATWVVEGEPVPAGGLRLFATVMVTIDLASCAAYLREPADAATAARVATLMDASPAVARRLIEMGRPRLLRLLGAPGRGEVDVSIEHRARAEGARILIDGDVVLTLGAAR